MINNILIFPDASIKCLKLREIIVKLAKKNDLIIFKEEKDFALMKLRFVSDKFE